MRENQASVLLLSLGRRYELARAFADEIEARGGKLRLLAADLKPQLSAACTVATRSFSTPPATSPSFIPNLLDLCRKEEIRLIVPTIDTELLALADHREDFIAEGVQIAISDATLVRRCRDKRLTASLFAEIGIATPQIYPRDSVQYPCFVKPFDGSSSIGSMPILSSADLPGSVLSDPKMIFMELIGDEFSEYTVDAYFDRYGQLRCLIPRLRIEVRAGEVSKGVTRRDHVYDYLLPKLGGIKGARGCITLQLFANMKAGEFFAFEINPRFGGGFPLSYSAGANFPGWLIDEYVFERNVEDYDSWEMDLMMLRYDAKVLVHGYT